MEGNPAEFEAIGNRLGFQLVENTNHELKMVWQGPRFPAFLCLGIALALMFISVPILHAIRLRGFEGPAISLWYFPLMNLVLFPISLYLISLRRTIHFNHDKQQVILTKRTLFRKSTLSVLYAEIQRVEARNDQVYSGFAVAGSSAAEKFPVPSLRLVLNDDETVLLDRGSRRKLEDLGKQISAQIKKPLVISPGLRPQRQS